MTEKEELKKRLHSYLDIKAERAQIMEEIDALAGPKAANLDGMPKGAGNGDTLGGIVRQRAELMSKYQAKLADLTAAQEDIENLIECLPCRERCLMRYRYINGLTWEEVCVSMSYSWRQVHRLHSAILDRLVEQSNR